MMMAQKTDDEIREAEKRSKGPKVSKDPKAITAVCFGFFSEGEDKGEVWLGLLGDFAEYLQYLDGTREKLRSGTGRLVST